MSGDLIRRMREEPITKEMLQRIFSDTRFNQGLSFLVERARSLRAEGGLTIYKRLGSQSLRFHRRYGLADAESGNFVYEPQIASVNSLDPDDIDPVLWLTAGTVHSHPPVTYGRPSQTDVDIFTEMVTSAENEIVVPSKHAFDMLVYLPKADAFHCQLFAYSLPGNTTGFSYLDMNEAHSTDEAEDKLKKSGFKVVRAIVPVRGSRVELTPEIVKKLAEGLET